METIHMHNAGQAKQSQDRQKPGKNQARVAHPSNVQPHTPPYGNHCLVKDPYIWTLHLNTEMVGLGGMGGGTVPPAMFTNVDTWHAVPRGLTLIYNSRSV